MRGRPLYYALAVMAALVLMFAASTSSGTVRKTFHVKGFTCASCASSLEAALRAKKGVNAVEADFASGQVEVTFDEAVIKESEIRKVIEQAGFSVTDSGDGGSEQLPRKGCC